MNRFLRAATLRMSVFSALLLCAATTARASEVDDLRAQLEALKSSYQTQITTGSPVSSRRATVSVLEDAALTWVNRN